MLYSRSPKSTTLVTLMQKHLAQYLIEHRIALNYKRLPYRTEWVEYPDIEATLRAIGGAPTAKVSLNDGSGGKKDHYTLPAIHDSHTNAVITDS